MLVRSDRYFPSGRLERATFFLKLNTFTRNSSSIVRDLQKYRVKSGDIAQHQEVIRLNI